MRERAVAVRERWRGASAVSRVAVGLILVQTLERVWQTYGGNYWQDDFVFLRLARTWGMGAEYLGHDHNGHLQPLGWSLSWVGAQLPGHYWPAATFVVLLQLAASVAIWRLIRQVVGSRPVLLVGLAAYLFTPLAVPTVTWWASFVITVPLHLAMAGMALCHRRYVAGEGRVWLAGSFGSLLGGFVVTEKAVVIPVFVLLLGWMTHRTGLRDFVRAQVRQLPIFLGYAVVVGGYLALYFRVVDSVDNSVGTTEQFLRLLRAQALDVFPVGMIGGPWSETLGDRAVFPESSPWVLAITAQVFLLLALVGWWRRGRQSLLVWLSLVLYVLVNVAITAAGRGAFGDLLAQDARYLSDAVPLGAVAISVLLTPTRPAVHLADRWARRHALVVGVSLAVLLFNSSMVSTSRLAPQMKHEEVARYVANVRAALASDPNLDLWSEGVPQNIMVAAFPERDKLAREVLAAYGVHPRFDVTSPDLRVLDETGVPRRPFLSFPAEGEIPRRTAPCGVALGVGEPRRIDLDRSVSEGRFLLELGYFTSGRGALTVSFAGSDHPVGLDSGSRSVFVAVSGGDRSVDLELESGRGTVCVTSLQIGYPIPDLESDG